MTAAYQGSPYGPRSQSPATRQNQEAIIAMLEELTGVRYVYPNSKYSHPGVAQNPATRQNQEIMIAQLQEIIEHGGGGGTILPERDPETGEYTNESIRKWLAAKRDNTPYGVSIPKSSPTTLTKTNGLIDVSNPTPGYVGVPAIDPYEELSPFFWCYVNGYADADGVPHVTAFGETDDFEADPEFSMDGDNGEVLVLTPVLYWLDDEDGANDVIHAIRDSAASGYVPQPGALLPDGTLRPYMLYAKDWGGKGADGKMHSYSGLPPFNRTVSHNSLRTITDTANTGWSGKNTADDWYVKTMFELKYGTKNSQSVFAGCSSYNYSYDITVAETGVKRAIIASSNAANLLVGSTVTIGTANNGTQVLTETRITSIEEYDESNSIINLDAASSFDTAVGNKLSTAPWYTGVLDDVDGDGTITAAGATSGKEPFKIQGICCASGMNEILGNVIVKSDGATGWKVYVNHDSRNESTTVTSDYEDTGKKLPSDATDGWKYPTYPTNAGGLLMGENTGGSTSMGLCDGEYVNKTETSGEREWRSVGGLGSGGGAGLWCVGASGGLSLADWYIGSRLSAIGRSREAA